jgi:hypothetical protein
LYNIIDIKSICRAVRPTIVEAVRRKRRLELIRRGYGARVGTWDSKEVDFVARAPLGGTECFQVCLGYYDEEAEKREPAPLGAIRDSHPKTAILLNGWPRSSTEEGITVRGRWTGSSTGGAAPAAGARPSPLSISADISN